MPPGAARVAIDNAEHLRADDQAVGALSVLRLNDGVVPAPLGDGLYEMPAGADLQAVAAPRLRAGQTEASNVVPSQEMVQLMEAFDWGLVDFEWVTINTVKSAFAPFPERLRIINGIVKPRYALAKAEQSVGLS